MGYTYLIGWSHLDKWYYGVRFAKGCSIDDLWSKYFTSSNRVKKFRTSHGEPDIVEVRQVFDSRKAAQDWEARVLKRMRVVKSPRWLNANDTFRYDAEITPEMLKARGDAIKRSWDAMTADAKAERLELRRRRWNEAFAAKDLEARARFLLMSREKIDAVNSYAKEARVENGRRGALALQEKIMSMNVDDRKAFYASQAEGRRVTRAAMSDEKKDEWKENTRNAWSDEMKATAAVTTKGNMKSWHASRTPAEHEAWKEKLRKPKSIKPSVETIAKRKASAALTISRRKQALSNPILPTCSAWH